MSTNAADPDKLLEEARFFSDVGKLKAASEILDEALRSGADPAATHALIALNSVRDSKWRLAERHIELAEAAGFDEPWFERMRGRVAYRRGRTGEAADAFRRALAAAPSDLAAIFDALCAELSCGDDTSARSHLQRMRAIDAGDPRTAKATGLLALYDSRFDDARDVLSQFAESEDCEGLNNLAVALIALGESGKSRAAMRRALISGERTAYWDDMQHNRRLLVGQTMRSLSEDPDADVPLIRRSGVKPYILVGVPLVIALLLRNTFQVNAIAAVLIVAAVAAAVLLVVLSLPGEYRALPLQSGVVVRRPSRLAALRRRSS